MTQSVILIVVSWSLLVAAVTSQALFREALLGPLDLALVATVSTFGGVLLADLGKAILGYFASMLAGCTLVYFLAILPSLTGILPATDVALLQELWIGIVVRAIFPFPFIGFLAAAVIGGALGEQYL